MIRIIRGIYPEWRPRHSGNSLTVVNKSWDCRHRDLRRRGDSKQNPEREDLDLKART